MREPADYDPSIWVHGWLPVACFMVGMIWIIHQLATRL